MLKKESKFNIIKNANYQSEKQIENIKYPDLYSHTKYAYNNNSKINNYSTNKKRLSSSTSKQLSRTSSAFFERNYNNYLEKIFSKKNFINSSMIRAKELNDLLYKLKKYNNEINTYIQQKNDSLIHLKETLKLIEFKYTKLKELQDIELPDEKISVKNFNELKMSKDDIEQKLFMLIKEKQDIDYSLKNEQEYNKTIEYMFEDEQNRLLSIKRETNIIEQKIYNVQKYQKIVNDNLIKSSQKDKNYGELNKKIDNDIKIIDEVNNKQNIDNQKLEHEIMLKENEVKILQDQIKELKENNNSDLNEYKKEIKEEIEQAKEKQKKRIEDEKKYIEIIYCLYIIQKYFIEEENFNKEKLLSSKDYLFLTKMIPDFISSYNETKKINTENFEKIATSTSNTNKKLINRALSNIKIKNNITNANDTTTQEDKKSFITTNKNNSAYNLNKVKPLKINPNKTSSTFINTKLDINSYYNNDNNNIEDLIDKFNEIKLNKQMLFDYNSSLISKLNFYRSQLDDFHFKEIKLEGIKKNNETKVKEIISDNYFIFEELTKYNEKCKNFLENNEYFINKMKKNNRKKKMNIIIERINKDNKDKKTDEPDDEEEENNRDKDISEEEKKEIDADDIVFKYSKNIIMNVNNFFLTCSDLLKDIIVSINNMKNANIGEGKGDKKNKPSAFEDDNSIFMKENNITEETSDNPYIEVFKKLADYQKIREIDISNDYKLLLQYIKNLIRFTEEKPDIQNDLDIKELNTNLADKFYKIGDDSNNKKIDKLFVKRFLSKKTPNFNNIFNHFTILLEPTMTNIKTIYEIIHDDSSQQYLNNIIQNKVDINQKGNNKKIMQPLYNSENLTNNENIDTEIKDKKYKKYRRLSSSKSEINKNEELCFDEEDIDSIDTQSTKKKIIKIRKRVKSIDEKVINNLYTPFLKKTIYLRKLNPNIPGIKQMTSNSSKTNFELKKMINDVDTISHQMKIYNNPILDPNKLNKDTYNSLVKLMLNDNNKNNIKGKNKNKKGNLSLK